MERRGIRITGTGIRVPDRIVSNDELLGLSGGDSDWVVERLGIRERRYVDSSERTSDIATIAAFEALKDAKFEAKDIDLLIVATATPDMQAPATACMVQRNICNRGAAAFDVSAVCCGFLYGLTTAAQYISGGMYDSALVIGADTFSRVVDTSRKDSVFFGDGAGAVVLQASWNSDAMYAAELVSLGEGIENFFIPSETRIFEMNPRGVFQAAVSSVPQAIERVLARANMEISDVDLVIPHQPSITLLKEIARHIGIDFSKFVTNMDRYANTAAGTIPIALHEAVVSGRLKRGDAVLFAAAGAGMTAAASVLRW
ncbi:3-oxoacyl-ACP synthase III family protein [Burkholderia sp. LMG 21824]|uniref:3-oxoacyl-ACP synthase III family protein n=1 Tax=Burkholderia sp. LMG 21824 TaxID=3158172 RepID=UPI003C2CABBE